MTRGAFITIEGGEGVGKTTSLEAIERLLAARGINVLMTREPGGTPLGESVRSWILDGDHGQLSAIVEALLMFAARSEHLDKLIEPSLRQGRWVVCDRFTDATFAYQGGGRGASEAFLQTLADTVQRGLEPDLTILLDAPVAIGLERISGRQHDHFERESVSFFERVRATYLERAAKDPRRFRIIDASSTPEEVGAAIERELTGFCRQFDEPRAAAP